MLQSRAGTIWTARARSTRQCHIKCEAAAGTCQPILYQNYRNPKTNNENEPLIAKYGCEPASINNNKRERGERERERKTQRQRQRWHFEHHATSCRRRGSVYRPCTSLPGPRCPAVGVGLWRGGLKCTNHGVSEQSTASWYTAPAHTSG